MNKKGMQCAFCTINAKGEVTDIGIADAWLENEEAIRKQLIEEGVIQEIVYQKIKQDLE